MNKTALLRGIALGGAAFGVLAAAVTQSALAADASNGERLAMRWCAACHVVAGDQREANVDAPPFEEIAKRPNFSELTLTGLATEPSFATKRVGPAMTEARIPSAATRS
jgi:mono/diheme cytochrome c family protein